MAIEAVEARLPDFRSHDPQSLGTHSCRLRVPSSYPDEPATEHHRLLTWIEPSRAGLVPARPFQSDRPSPLDLAGISYPASETRQALFAEANVQT